MLKRSLSLLVILLLHTIGYAQKITISPNQVDDGGFDNLKVLGQNDDGYFVLMSNLDLDLSRDRVGLKNRKLRLSWYDTALLSKWTKPVTPFPEDGNIDAISFINGQILVLTSMAEKQGNKVSLYAQWISPEGNINRSNNPVTTFSLSKVDYEKTKIIPSANKQLLALVMHEFASDDRQEDHLAVLDTSMKVLFQKSININLGEKNFDDVGYALSNDGDFVMLGLKSEKIKSMSAKRKYDYLVFASDRNSETFRELSLASDKDIAGVGLEFDNINHKVVFAGFYTDRSSFTGAGIIYASLEMKSDSQLKIQAHSIDSQQNIKLTGERNSRSGLSIVGYPIERIVLRNDGGAVIVAEASYTSEYSYYDYFTQSFTRQVEFHFDNVVIISVNSDGTVDWSNIVEKEQVSLDDGGVFSSFCSLLNSEELILVYNEDISRMNEVMSVSIDNRGKQVKNKPLKTSERLLLLPRSGKQVSENGILIPAYQKKKMVLVRFDFDS